KLRGCSRIRRPARSWKISRANGCKSATSGRCCPTKRPIRAGTKRSAWRWSARPSCSSSTSCARTVRSPMCSQPTTRSSTSGSRDKYGSDRVDSSGKLVTGEKFKGPIELRELLLKQKRGDFLRCVTEKMLTYALGRGLEYYDRPTLDQIARNIDRSGAKFSSL